MLQEKNVNIGLVKPLLKTFPVSGESPAALSYISIEEYPLHTQLHMELIYVAEGSISVKVGVSNYILHAGEFTIINPFELHALYATSEPNRVCILEINRDFYDPCEEENIFVSAYSLYQDASGKDFVQIKNLLNKIFALHLFSRSGENPDVLHLPAGVAENDVQYEKILLRSLINYFELHFTHEYFLLSDDKENSLRDRAQQANRLKSILLYFYENFPQKIQLQDIADVTFINRYYISHLVKSGVGLTFSELLQHIRVEKSEIYLLGTQMPVSQIVYELGFSSYRYFSLHFKRLFDMTPAAYRKKFAQQTIRYKNVTAARSTMPADMDRALAMFSEEHIARVDIKGCMRADAESIARAACADCLVEDVETALPRQAVLYDTPFFPAVLLSRMASGVMGDTACGMESGGICSISPLHEYGRFFEEETAVGTAIKDKGMNCGFDLGGGVVSAGEAAYVRDFGSDGIFDAGCGEESDCDSVFCGEPGSIAKYGLRKSVFYLKEMLRPFLRQDMRFADSAIILPGIFLIKQQKTIEILLYNYPACVNIGAGETAATFPFARLLDAKELHDFYSLAKNCRDQCWHLDLSGLMDTGRILIKKSELKFETDAFLQWGRMGRPPSIDENIAEALNDASAPDSYFEIYELPGESGGLYPVTLKPFHVQRISLFL